MSRSLLRVMLQPSFFKFQDEHEDPGYALRADEVGGPGRVRTDDLFHAMEARSQLRHRPIRGEETARRTPR